MYVRIVVLYNVQYIPSGSGYKNSVFQKSSKLILGLNLRRLQKNLNTSFFQISNDMFSNNLLILIKALLNSILVIDLCSNDSNESTVTT